ncbi:HTH_Tnp_Tc3_2 domain-containing protein [Trichonephila clavipes]|nr:HTH_Tnp_Tc3_2 domain-containing protein [Trichonephila clavipes]
MGLKKQLAVRVHFLRYGGFLYLVCRGHPEPGLRLNDISRIQWYKHRLTAQLERPNKLDTRLAVHPSSIMPMILPSQTARAAHIIFENGTAVWCLTIADLVLLMEAGISFSTAPYRRISIVLGGSFGVCRYKLLGAVDTRRYPRAENRIWSDQEDQRREDRRIVLPALLDPTVTRSMIRADVGVAVVPQTISRHLAEANLKSNRPFRALSLTPEHRLLRLQWPSQIDVECHRLTKGCV